MSSSIYELSQGLALPPLPRATPETKPLIDWIAKYLVATRKREGDTSTVIGGVIQSDVLANRPSVAPGGAIYLATDTLAVYVFDSATGTWIQLVTSTFGFHETVTTTAVTPYTVVASDWYIRGAAGAGADQIILLPPATDIGRELTVKKTDANAHNIVLTADTGNPDLIDGVATYTLGPVQYVSVTVKIGALHVWDVVNELAR